VSFAELTLFAGGRSESGNAARSALCSRPNREPSAANVLLWQALWGSPRSSPRSPRFPRSPSPYSDPASQYEPNRTIRVLGFRWFRRSEPFAMTRPASRWTEFRPGLARPGKLTGRVLVRATLVVEISSSGAKS